MSNLESEREKQLKQIIAAIVDQKMREYIDSNDQDHEQIYNRINQVETDLQQAIKDRNLKFPINNWDEDYPRE